MITTTYGFETAFAPLLYGSSQLSGPTVTALRDGGWFLAFNAPVDIVYGIRESDGTARTGIDELNSTASLHKNPAAAQLADGRIVAVWHDIVGNGESVIRGRTLDRDGAPVPFANGSADDFVVWEGFGAQQQPDVAALADGGFIVAWEDVDSTTDRGIAIRVFGADGSSIAREIENDGVVNRDPAVAALRGGGAVVAYTKVTASGSTQIHAEIHRNGSQVGGDILVDGVGTINEQPAVVGTMNGGFAVAYRDNGWGDPQGDITLARFTGAGQLLGYTRVNAASPAGSQNTPDIAELPNGLLLVSWANGGDSATVDRALVDAQGRVVADPAGVLATTATAPASAILGDGRVVTTYLDISQAADEQLAVRAVIEEIVRTSRGGAGADTIAGDGLRDVIVGAGGADMITGAGGNDAIDGGEGADSALWQGARSGFALRTDVGGDGRFYTTVRALAEGGEGTDVVVDVETFGFAGRAYGLAGIQQNATANLDGGAFNDILLQNAATGAVRFVDTGPGGGAFATLLGALPTGWQAHASGDLSGDGVAEVVIGDASGTLYAYQAGGSWTPLATLTPDWTVIGTGDFTGDGRLDVVVRHAADGTTYFRDGDPDGGAGWGVLPNVGVDWRIVGFGDMDRDGVSDMVIQEKASGLTYFVDVNAGGAHAGWGYVAGGLGESWVGEGVGDLNGDGFDDVVFRNTNTGQIWAVDMLGGTNSGWLVVTNDVGLGWDVGGVIDHDNDGFDDVLIRNTADGTVYAADIDAGVFGGWDALAGPLGADWSLV